MDGRKMEVGFFSSSGVSEAGDVDVNGNSNGNVDGNGADSHWGSHWGTFYSNSESLLRESFEAEESRSHPLIHQGTGTQRNGEPHSSALRPRRRRVGTFLRHNPPPTLFTTAFPPPTLFLPPSDMRTGMCDL